MRSREVREIPQQRIKGRESRKRYFVGCSHAPRTYERGTPAFEIAKDFWELFAKLLYRRIVNDNR